MSALPIASLSDSGGRSLRVPATAAGGGGDRGPVRVLRVDPPDGTRGVFRDTRVVCCLSRPVDTRTVSVETFIVSDESGVVPGGVWTSLDGRIAVWTPGRLLTAGKVHSVRLARVRDLSGRDVDVHESTFVPCDVSLDDLGP